MCSVLPGGAKINTTYQPSGFRHQLRTNSRAGHKNKHPIKIKQSGKAIKAPTGLYPPWERASKAENWSRRKKQGCFAHRHSECPNFQKCRKLWLFLDFWGDRAYMTEGAFSSLSGYALIALLLSGQDVPRILRGSFSSRANLLREATRDLPRALPQQQLRVKSPTIWWDII